MTPNSTELMRGGAWTASAASRMRAPAPKRDTGPAERMAWADIAKGVCIILVVMMHSTLGVQNAAQARGFLDPVVAFAQPFRMPAFFLLSGFFFAGMAARGWSELLTRRVLPLAYVLVLWSLILFVAKGGLLQLASLAETLAWAAMALIEPNGALWFLHALIIFAAAARLTRTWPVWLLLGAAAALHLASPQTGWTALDEFASRAVFFFAGCRLAPWLTAFAASARAERGTALMFVAAACISTALAAFGGPATSGNPLVSLVAGAIGGLGLMAACVLIEGASIARPLAALGRMTLGIYVSFTIPMAVSRVLLIKAGLTDTGVISLMVTLTALVSAVLLWRLTPMLRLRLLFEPPTRLGGRRQRNTAISDKGFLPIAGTRQPSAG
jgi:uncharacterized membrane protein YcfT